MEIERLKQCLNENSATSKAEVQNYLDEVLIPLLGEEFSIHRNSNGGYSIHYGRHIFITEDKQNPKIRKKHNT